MIIAENQSLVAAICITTTLLLLCMLVGHLLHTSRWANQSIVSLSIGLFTGVIVFVTSNGQSSHTLQFNEDLFFYYVLPPIIFNAGFQVKKKHFFQNFVAIMLFGVTGVVISFFVITVGCYLTFPNMGLPLSSMDLMALGVIFSATDSVSTWQVLQQDETPLLYSLVFGEGVINDASSVVLFNAIKDLDLFEIDFTMIFSLLGKFLYLFLTSTVLGISVGLLSAFMIKKLSFSRHSTDREVSIMILMPYLSYMLSELCDLSGILTLFFCGIVMSHYTWHNVTESSQTTTRHAFATMSFVAETFIFLYVGMDALDKEKWKATNVGASVSISLSAALLLSVILGRAAFVFPLSALSNAFQCTHSTRISFRHQVIMWWAGLMRGSVSVALAYSRFTVSGTTRSQAHATTITSTIIVVVFSTVFFGSLTKPLVEWALPHHLRATAVLPENLSDNTLSNVPLLGNGGQHHRCIPERPSSLQLLLNAPTSPVHNFWRRFDNAYMRPMFGSPR